MLTRLLLAAAGGSGSFTAPDQTLYALFNGQNGDGIYAIGAATRATDGTWSEYGSNPVLQKGSSGAWDDDHVKDPWLLWDGSQYVTYYAGYDGAKYQVGRATAASHEGPWTKYASNPVVAVGAGGAIDDAGVNFPTVLYEPEDTGKEWKMWYGADDGSVQTIAYAYSTNGTSWTKVGRVLNVGTGGAWDDVGVLPGAIYKSGLTYHLFYGGRQSATPSYFWQGGLATFTDPEGTYTRSGSNPVQKARFNDANTSQTLDADPSPGATVVDIPTPSALNIGEPVVIADSDTTAENFYLTAVGASTVTLDHAISGTFTNANGGRFRSFAFQSVFPRAALSRAAGYELIGTVFQPVDDLTQPASKIWEGAFEWAGSSLTGLWTYNYVAGRGLLFPLSPVGAAWHTRSAENPSVIAAP